jgi:hypothetical protein
MNVYSSSPPPAPRDLYFLLHKIRRHYANFAVTKGLSATSSLAKSPLPIRAAGFAPRLQRNFESKMRRYGVTKELIDNKIDAIIRTVTVICGAILTLASLVSAPLLMYYLMRIFFPPGFDLGFIVLNGFVFAVIYFFLRKLKLLNLAVDPLFDKTIAPVDNFLQKTLAWSEFKSFFATWLVLLLLLLLLIIAPLFLLITLLRETWWSMLPLPFFLAVTVFFMFLLMGAGMLKLIISIQSLCQRQMIIQHPEVYLANYLFDLLVKLNISKDRWNEPAFKNEVAAELERIAATFALMLPRGLRGFDIDTQLWLKTNFSEVAQAIRGQKKLVFAPEANGCDKLARRLSLNLYHLVEGNWSNLDTESIEKLTLREGSWLWLKRIWSIVKSLLVALVPLGLVYALEYASQYVPELKVESAQLSYAKIGGLIWLAISLLLMIDPLFNSKLGAVKDVKGLLGFSGDKK